ncbi:SDR family NAD(P)-dependent oxidoreductase [Flavimaricola marinus]|uniref:Gluconate 5-dehydrogenase n=1 Tax=Flavimaricola marinus TaxID=1819565 RepID=A0A238LAK9_9RHOB|nr:SDR family oxidoreductase [Flavimaricola marinus]SMY06709.1 Gluconate 5-dehydrogenase [Flavimaricola marinus]
MHATFHDLKGASVFITGGGSGIGAALTKGFLEQGAKVAFVGRSDYADFAAELSAATGNPPMFLQCDVTDTAALHAAMDRAAEAHGPITVLVNNAANDQRMDASTVTEQMWQEMIDVNFKHYFFAAQKAAQTMRETGGSIINYSSISYMMASTGMAPYVASNAGITGLTRALAREWGPVGIRVNAIAPGWVLTQKQIDKWASKEALDAHLARQCLPDTIQPEDMVGGTLFLASAASRMMTGQVMPIDAGVVVTG